MSKRRFTKPFTSYQEQLEKLRNRGLVIPDWEEAGWFISYCNYYRLSGYILAFEKERNVILPGTTFDDVKKLYEFDRALRGLVWEAIAVIEVSVKSRVAYQLGESGDPFLHKNKQLFQNTGTWHVWLEKIRKDTKGSKEPFVNHFKETYAEYPDLPIWVLTELMSFGSLSTFYSEIQGVYQRQIAWYFGVPHTILESWLHSLTYVRNLCAHHARLWDRYLCIFSKIPKRRSEWDCFRENNLSRRTFFTLSIIKFLLNKIKEHTNVDIDWSKRIVALMDNHPHVPNFERHMGIPGNWKQMDLWQYDPFYPPLSSLPSPCGGSCGIIAR
jgi:abortive infection bacteriophage resistance protein